MHVSSIAAYPAPRHKTWSSAHFFLLCARSALNYSFSIEMKNCQKSIGNKVGTWPSPAWSVPAILKLIERISNAVYRAQKKPRDSEGLRWHFQQQNNTIRHGRMQLMSFDFGCFFNGKSVRARNVEWKDEAFVACNYRFGWVFGCSEMNQKSFDFKCSFDWSGENVLSEVLGWSYGWFASEMRLESATRRT